MTKRVVLIGHPVAHSLSGAMQQAAFDSAGIDARYELWDKAPIALGDAIDEVRGDDGTDVGRTLARCVASDGERVGAPLPQRERR